MKTALTLTLTILSLSLPAFAEDTGEGRSPASLMEAPILATDFDMKKESVSVAPEEYHAQANLLPDVEIDLTAISEPQPGE